jgi:hypothetical protein
MGNKDAEEVTVLKNVLSEKDSILPMQQDGNIIQETASYPKAIQDQAW